VSERPVFVFIDESGNFDFTERGTRFFVLSAHVTTAPEACSSRLQALTYEFLARADSDQIPFHASENSTATRTAVIKNLCFESDGCHVVSVWIRKSDIHPDRQNTESLFSILAAEIGARLTSEARPTGSAWVFLFDMALPKRQQQPALKKLKRQLAELGVRFVIAFRPVTHDVNGQIADYYAWATLRGLERGDRSWLETLPGRHEIHEIKS
jgi:hypothetical protein